MLSEQLDVMLVKAFDVARDPGRNSDDPDTEWSADLAAHGLVRPSFVPSEDIRQLQVLTRVEATHGHHWRSTDLTDAATGWRATR